MPRFATRAKPKNTIREEPVEEDFSLSHEEAVDFRPVKKEKELSPFEQKLNDWVNRYLTRVPFVQRMFFVHHLQIMVKAGLPIVNALNILEKEIENKKLKLIASEIRGYIERGKQLSEAMALYPHIFPQVYVSMIAAGETAGKMEESLSQVSIQMKKSHDLSSRIKGAMVYPGVIVTAMIGIGIEVVVFVLPKLMTMFDEFHAELPLPTRILIKITQIGQILFASKWIIATIGVIVGLAALVTWLYRQPGIKRMVHALNLKLPIFGHIIQEINLARFTMTLSSLMQSTIPIIEAVKITSQVMGNVIYREKLLIVAEELKKGETLSKLLEKFPKIFPPMVTEMVMVGEESGKVEDMLNEMAEYYGNEVDNTMKNFSTIIEPVIILVMGLAVAGLAVAVIMPMYTLAQSF